MRRLALLLLLAASPALATDYYISTTGSDTTPGTCTLEYPCATFPKCGSLMVAGDTCYARGGTYTTAPGTGANGWTLYPLNSGTASQRITFRGYPGETAIIQPTTHNGCQCPTGGCDGDTCDPAEWVEYQDATMTFGDARDPGHGDYITISDLTIRGRLDIAENDDTGAWHLTIERITFKCPGAVGTGNATNFMTQGHNNLALEDSTVREGLVVRDNLFLVDSSCPDYCALYSAINRPYVEPDFIHLYGNTGAIIENNDFRNTDPTRTQCRIDAGDVPQRFFIWLKGMNEYTKVRYNYCNGGSMACVALTSGGCGPDYADASPDERTCTPEDTFFVGAGNNEIYQNISDKSGSIGFDSNNYGYQEKVYNNTLYRVSHSGTGGCPDGSCVAYFNYAGTNTWRGNSYSETFNNLAVSDPADSTGSGEYSTYFRWYGVDAKNDICNQAIADWNIYYPFNAARTVYFASNHLGSTQFFATLAAYQSWLHTTCPTRPGVWQDHSTIGNPLLENPEAHNFHLSVGSPALSGGRGGGWSTTRGAYITGDEIIGCTFDPGCFSYGAAVDPGTPYYISTSGDDLHGCTNSTDDACASFPRCAQVMDPGDTCYAMDGTYNTWDTNPTGEPYAGWVIDSPGGTGPTARKRFTSYSQDPTKVVIQRAYPESVQNNTWGVKSRANRPPEPLNQYGKWLEFDHLTFRGTQSFWGGSFTGLSFHHNLNYCPTAGRGYWPQYASGNQSLFYTPRSPQEMHANVTIYENLFYMDDSCPGIDEGNPAVPSSYSRSLIAIYDTNGAVLERNDFINAQTEASTMPLINWKCCNKDSTTRYNYAQGAAGTSDSGWHDGACGGDGTAPVYMGQWGDRTDQGGSNACHNVAHHNVFVDVNTCMDPGGDQFHGFNRVYNNTCIRTEYAGIATEADSRYTSGIWHSAFNNLLYNPSKVPTGGFIMTNPYSNEGYYCLSDWSLVNYNLYYPSTGDYVGVDCNADSDGDGTWETSERQRYSSLASWQAHAAPSESASITGDPKFVDYAGGNFRLGSGSPALTGGRGGVWGSVIGAYQTGVEQIGCSFSPACSQYGKYSEEASDDPAETIPEPKLWYEDGGTQYWVRADGNDANDGLRNDPDNAWRTVYKCLTTVPSGGTCNIGYGTYTERTAMTIPAGAVVASDVAACTCTEGATSITCDTPVTIASGQYVRCDGSEPGFAWTRTYGVTSGATIPLTEPYRGRTTSSSLDVARLTRLRGMTFETEDTSLRAVKITTWTGKPANVTWVQDPTYPSVWYYSTVGVTDPGWSSPKGFRTDTETWNTYYELPNGRDPYYYLTPGGCPCRAATAAETVYRVPGSWYHDTGAQRVYLQTWDQKRPGTTNDASDAKVQAGTQSNAVVTMSDYTIIENLAIEGSSHARSSPYCTEELTFGTGSCDGYAISLQANVNQSRAENVWLEGARLGLRRTPATPTSNLLISNVRSMNSTLGHDPVQGYSGIKFYRYENRGGGPNGLSLGMSGLSSSDRVIYDRLYLHRAMPPLYGIGQSPACGTGDTYDCAARAWKCTANCGNSSDPRYLSCHLWYATAESTTPAVDHFWIQNSVFEVGNDGVAQFSGGGQDGWFVNNTFGTHLRHNSTLKAKVGSTVGTPRVYLYNNLFMSQDPAEGSIYHAGSGSYVTSDYNVHNYWGLSGTADPRIWNQTETFSGVQSSFNQETHSYLVCSSGCTGARVSNAGGSVGVIDALPHDGDPTDYTPLETFVGVDAGLDTYCPPYDFYGMPRNDGDCDIGAIEYQGPYVPPIPDTDPPAPVTSFTGVPGNQQVTLQWTHSITDDSVGTMVRFSTTGYPTGVGDGTLVCNKTAPPGSSDSCLHSGLTNGQVYYYTAFAYDEVPNYSTGSTTSAMPTVAGPRKTTVKGTAGKGVKIK